jgi:hypothetical protein
MLLKRAAFFGNSLGGEERSLNDIHKQYFAAKSSWIGYCYISQTPSYVRVKSINARFTIAKSRKLSAARQAAGSL